MTEDLAPGLHIPPVPAEPPVQPEPDPTILAAEKTLENRVADLEKDVAAIAADLSPITDFLKSKGFSLETFLRGIAAKMGGWF